MKNWIIPFSLPSRFDVLVKNRFGKSGKTFTKNLLNIGKNTSSASGFRINADDEDLVHVADFSAITVMSNKPVVAVLSIERDFTTEEIQVTMRIGMKSYIVLEIDGNTATEYINPELIA